VLLHGSRQVASWLIFDVGQKMKRVFLTFLLSLAGCATRPPSWEFKPPDGISAAHAEEFAAFLKKIGPAWEKNLVAIRSQPKFGTSLVLVLVPDKERKLRVDRIEDVSDGIEKNSIWAAVEATRQAVSMIQFSEALFAELAQRGEVRISFHYRDEEKPNQSLEPTSPSVTSRADARLAPAGAAAHL
jgi:hypothetical protein